MNRTVLILAGLLAFPACGRSEEKPPEPKVEVKEEPKASAPEKEEEPEIHDLAPIEPETKLGEIPVPEDLEEEAERTVAFENLEAELDRLEAEIVGSGD